MLQTKQLLNSHKVYLKLYLFRIFAKEFPPKMIWSLTCRNDEAWGIQGYEIFKHYADPLKQMKDRD